MINNYKDLTLEKYLELRAIPLDQEEIDIQSQMLAVLNDCTVDEILDLKLDEYHKLVGQMSFLTEEPQPVKKVPREVTIGKNKYEVIKDARSMTAGQFIDYQNYIKDINTTEKNLPLLMTCFCIPKGKKYGDYDFVEVADDMKKLPIEMVLGLAGFFFRKSQRLIDNTLTYLDWTVKRMQKREKNKEIVEKMTEARQKLHILKSLVKDGDGLLS
jgi:hypothetical protein